MLALARALATDPALLLLDELSMGLAPLIVEQLYEQVKAITATGTAILLVEQFAGSSSAWPTRWPSWCTARSAPQAALKEVAGHLTGAYLGATTTGDPV